MSGAKTLPGVKLVPVCCGKCFRHRVERFHVSRLEFTLAQLDILTSFAQSVHSLLLGPSWYDQSYTVPMPCSGLEKLSPDPFMMLMMHYSASFTSLASPNHFFDAFLTLLLNALPHQAQHPLCSLRSPRKLKPCLSAGFRDIRYM